VDPEELRARRRVVVLAPGGRLLDEALVTELAAEPALTLLCGRYEGFDERILEHYASDVVSIGRYVLSGGELAAMVGCDAVLLAPDRSVRLVWVRSGAPSSNHEQRNRNHRARAVAPCPELRAGRPGARALPGDRGIAPPRADLRGRRDQAPGPRCPRDFHGAQ